MEYKRLLELALETLEKKRADVERAIEEILEFQNGKKRVFSRKRDISSLVVVKRRSKTLTERKALSRKLKMIWKAKKLQAAKTAPAKAKGRRKTAAEKKALSLKMKMVWAKKRAVAAKKAG